MVCDRRGEKMGVWELTCRKFFRVIAYLLQYRIKTRVFTGLFTLLWNFYTLEFLCSRIHQYHRCSQRGCNHSANCSSLSVGRSYPHTLTGYYSLQHIRKNISKHSGNVCKTTCLHRLSVANLQSGFTFCMIEVYSHF